MVYLVKNLHMKDAKLAEMYGQNADARATRDALVGQEAGS